MLKRRTLLGSLLATGLCAAGSPSFAEEQPPVAVKDVFLAHTQVQNSVKVPTAAMATAFKREVEQRTQGRVRVTIFPDSQLGGNRDLMRLTTKGIIQSALVSSAGMIPAYPPIGVIQVPFALDSIKAAGKVFDGPFGQKLGQGIERKSGLKVLGYGDGGGFFVLTNSRHPIRHPDDLKGLRIRSIPGFKALDDVLKAQGAVPVNVSSREELAALATGVVDGQMNPPLVVLSRRIDEVQRYVTLTDHLYAPLVWIFNQDAFAHLDEAEQVIVKEAARIAIAEGRLLVKSLEDSPSGLPALYRRMEVTRLSPSERQDFMAATQPVAIKALSSSLDDEGKNLLEDFLRAAKN